MPADGELEEGLLSGTRKTSHSVLGTHGKKMAAGLVVLVALASLWSLGRAAFVPKPIAPTFPISEGEQLNWAQYSPYFALGKYEQPPGSCRIDQVRCSHIVPAILG